MARPVFAVIIGLVALVALLYPGQFERVRAGIQSPASPAAKSPPPSAQAPSATVQAPKMESGMAKSFAPKRSGGNGAPHAPAMLRSTAIAEQTRPLARPAKQFRTPAVPKADTDTGFVAKVLQADGTLKEEYFPSNPH